LQIDSYGSVGIIDSSDYKQSAHDDP
jgi:hypothetical protein